MLDKSIIKRDLPPFKIWVKKMDATGNLTFIRQINSENNNGTSVYPNPAKSLITMVKVFIK